MKKSRLSAVDNWCALAEQAMFNPAALAKLLGVSLRVLEMFFHARARRSPRSWLNELRLRIAAQRLAAGATVGDLFRELGYCHAAHFHHQFRDLFGRTPGEFVIEWKRRETEWIAQGGSASASAPPSRELAEAVRSLEAQLRGDLVRCPEPEGKVVRIVLVDDDPNARRIVQAAFGLLASDWQFESHSPSKEVVQRLAQEPPTAVLLGCRRPKKSRIDYLVMLAVCLPSLPIIMFAGNPDGDEILSALAAGAVGYVLKNAQQQQLVRAVQEVLQEGTFLCQQAKQAVVEFLYRLFNGTRQATLSPREREVCVLLLNKEKGIAETMNLSKKTVDVLVQRASQKFGSRGRRGLVRALTRFR